MKALEIAPSVGIVGEQRESDVSRLLRYDDLTWLRFPTKIVHMASDVKVLSSAFHNSYLDLLWLIVLVLISFLWLGAGRGKRPAELVKGSEELPGEKGVNEH